jgi:hypothetical protein
LVKLRAFLIVLEWIGRWVLHSFADYVTCSTKNSPF